MTALLLVLDFLADVADLLWLDFLSGLTDLHSMHGSCYLRATRLWSCGACLGRGVFVPESCLVVVSGEPEAVFEAERLVAAAMRAGAALIPEELRAGKERLSACRSGQTSKSLTGMWLLHCLPKLLQGACQGLAQLTLLGTLVMYRQSCAWI